MEPVSESKELGDIFLSSPEKAAVECGSISRCQEERRRRQPERKSNESTIRGRSKEISAEGVWNIHASTRIV